MMRSRVTFLARGTNGGKCAQLSDLRAAYMSYVQECLDLLVIDKLNAVVPSDRRSFFPSSSVLSSQIVKNCQAQAVDLVNTWSKGIYARKLAKHIQKQQNLTDHQRMELRCCGKYGVNKAGRFGKGVISQEMVDLYWGWVWDTSVSGNPPTVSDRLPMVMSEMTCTFGASKTSTHFDWWLKVSSLVNGKTIKLPLAATPYLHDGLQKTVIVSKTSRNGWRFQFSEKCADAVFDGSAGSVGVDVGLNVLAATSDGRLFGRSVKSRFDKLYKTVQKIRGNRQRQNLPRNSKRLDKLETKLTGLVKTATGMIANKLVKSFPSHTMVVEDLDLSGSRGAKRFAYRALQKSLETKAIVVKVNPAYTSQECPSCHFVSPKNRTGINFVCIQCGRTSHADVVGGVNLLRRSEDKRIHLNDHPSVVKRVLDTQFRTLRGWVSAPSHGSRSRKASKPPALVPSSRKLTVVGKAPLALQPRIASKLITTPF